MDEVAAARIKSDGIDILIDLSGQIRGNRLEILALKPAPLKVAYIGFLGSNGAAFIDYMFTDKAVPPEAHLDTYSEATAYPPHCYLITDDAIVFCSFNQGFKITPDVFDAWCEIIADTKDSALWLLEKNPLAKFNLRKEARTRGIDGDRLIFANQIPKPGLLALYRNPLADGRKSAPLFDTARYVRAMEHGFEEMWRRYLDGEAPARIDIPDR